MPAIHIVGMLSEPVAGRPPAGQPGQPGQPGRPGSCAWLRNGQGRRTGAPARRGGRHGVRARRRRAVKLVVAEPLALAVKVTVPVPPAPPATLVTVMVDLSPG